LGLSIFDPTLGLNNPAFFSVVVPFSLSDPLETFQLWFWYFPMMYVFPHLHGKVGDVCSSGDVELKDTLSGS